MIHLKAKVERLCGSQVSMWLIRELSSRVIGVLTCDQPHVSTVLCCQGWVWSPCVLYLGVHIMHQEGRGGGHDNNADNCLTDAHKRLSRRLSDRDLFMCFVNIHGSEYFVSQQSQMILSMPHLVVYMDIEWSENVNTHPNRICAYLTNIGNTMFWQCPLFSSPHPWDWSVTPYITGKLQHYHYLSPHLGPVSSDQH